MTERLAVRAQSPEALSHVLLPDLEAAYRQMADDEEREAQALEWAEATAGDVGDAAW